MKSQRILALDAFRGLVIALMILVNNPGSWSHIYAPLKHADWEGCTPTDLVFPFFLFIVGIASFLSFKKHHLKLTKKAFLKLLRRSILIFLIGFLLNCFPFYDLGDRLASIRVFGVLQRIACAYFIGVLLCLTLKSTKKIALGGISLMLIFWAILFIYNPTNPYDKKDNACRALDLVIPGEAHIYKGYSRTLALNNFDFTIVDNTHFEVKPKDNNNIDIKRLSFASTPDYKLEKQLTDNFISYNVIPRESISSAEAAQQAVEQLKPAKEVIPFDPEGLLGVISAVATVMFGFLIGRLINYYADNKKNIVLHLLLFGCLSVFIGMFWGQWFMINKALWTGSYVMYTGGLAMICLAFCIWLIDVKQYNQKLFRPFIAFGSNPLFLFVLAGVVAKSMNLACFNIGDKPLKTWLWENVFRGIISPEFGSMLYAIIFILIFFVIAEILYRKKIYIKV